MTNVHVLGYAAAVMLLIMMPGADFAVVLRQGLVGGRRGASAAGFGIATGLLIWSLAVATGLGALLAASATAYTAVKLVGVAYLLYLGMTALLGALRGASAQTNDAATAARDDMSWGASYRQGLLTNTLNPKVAVTFLALMPQFLPAQPERPQLLLLSLITVVLAGIWFQLVAVVVGGFRRVFARAAVRRAMDAVMGVVLVGFGVRLATE